MQKKIALKQLRIGLDMSQAEFAAALGITRTHYSAIETGRLKGTAEFWKTLKTTFGLAETKLWELMNNEKKG